MLIPILVAFGFSHIFYPAFQGTPIQVNGDSLTSLGIALSQWATITMIMGFFALHLDRAGTRSASPQQNARPWMPILFTSVFAVIVFLARIVAWVPVEIGALLACPFVLLPPLTYRVVHHQPGHNDSAPISPFTEEEINRVVSSFSMIPSIPCFLERYPHAKAYLYKSPGSGSFGGLLLHNRQKLAVPQPTFLEVTYTFPFTGQLGEFDSGKEYFRAYLCREKSSGCSILNLPHQNWDEWLVGQTKKQWFKQIQELDQLPIRYPHSEGIPFQLIENPCPWELIQLPAH